MLRTAFFTVSRDRQFANDPPDGILKTPIQARRTAFFAVGLVPSRVERSQGPFFVETWPTFDSSTPRGNGGGFRRIYSTSGNGDISHGNGPILDVPGKYEGLHAQRVTRPKYGVFSKK